MTDGYIPTDWRDALRHHGLRWGEEAADPSAALYRVAWDCPRTVLMRFVREENGIPSEAMCIYRLVARQRSGILGWVRDWFRGNLGESNG